jgi:hypothetical protein
MRQMSAKPVRLPLTTTCSDARQEPSLRAMNAISFPARRERTHPLTVMLLPLVLFFIISAILVLGTISNPAMILTAVN